MDIQDNNCEFYDNNAEKCGRYDDDDFTATILCCVCKPAGKIFKWYYFNPDTLKTTLFFNSSPPAEPKLIILIP